MRKIVLMILLAVFSSTAAADWFKVGSSDAGNATAYSDPSTILKNGSKVKMWTLLDFRIAKTIGDETYLSTRQKNEFDCNKRKIRLLTISMHSGNMGSGNVIYGNSNIGNWLVVPPDGLGAIFWKFACGKK